MTLLHRTQYLELCSFLSSRKLDNAHVEGTGWLESTTPNRKRHGREEDIDLLWSIQSKIEGNTICPLGDAASWPAAAIRHFREEFEYHVRFPEKKKKQEPFVAEPFEK
jgi:NADH-quinone oxidoreductase subunit F